MKVFETWTDGIDSSYYFILELKENEYLVVKRLEDGHSYVLYDAVYKINKNKEAYLFRNCTQEENDLAFKLIDEYYDNYLKGEQKK